MKSNSQKRVSSVQFVCTNDVNCVWVCSDHEMRCESDMKDKEYAMPNRILRLRVFVFCLLEGLRSREQLHAVTHALHSRHNLFVLVLRLGLVLRLVLARHAHRDLAQG
jgi:hypothetical protein